MVDGENTKQAQDSDGPIGPSGPHCFHLLVANDVVTEFHRYRTYVALCGELVGASELPSSLCSDDCDAEIVYCLECIRTANERNCDAGVEVDCPPGVFVRRDR